MSGLKIEKAVYGLGNVGAKQTNVVDVTTQVQKLVTDNGDYVQIFVDPSTFNIPDPVPGQTKGLTIQYVSQSGPTILVRGGIDGDYVTLVNQFPVQIQKAVYGGKEYGVDISEALSTYFNDPGAEPIQIGSTRFINFFCGEDPNPGSVKALSITMTYLGETNYMIGTDGRTISRAGSNSNCYIEVN